jgi:hypothetical protein
MVRLSYPNLFKKVAFNDDKDPTYSAMAVFDADGEVHELVDKTIKGLLKDEFGDDAKSIWNALVRKGRQLLHNGEEMEGKAGFSDAVSYVSAYGDTRPLVFRGKSSNPDLIAEEDGIVYPGCYGDMLVQFYTWKNGNGKGVGCELKGFRFRKDGERLGGAVPASVDDFPDLDDEDEVGSDWDNTEKAEEDKKSDDDWM